MVSLLARLLIKDYKSISQPGVRQAYGMLCGGVGIVLNTFLFLGKLLAGFLSGSIAVTADAFNNLSDAGSSIITLIGFKMAGNKPDSDHPFGHGRIEYISGFLVAVIIIIMAVELVKTSLNKILQPTAVETSPLILFILIISIAVKLYMYYYNKRIGSRIDSAAMVAASRDSLSDTAATTVVLVTTLLSQLTDIKIDGYCGMVVALFVFWAGISAVKDTISPLLGQPPKPEFVKKIYDIVMHYEIDGVLGLHDLVVHDYGPGRLMLSVHVEVPASGDMLTLHDMIDVIEHRLREELNCSAVIHMDPVSVDDILTNEIKDKIAAIIAGMAGDVTFHDFRIVSGPTHTNLIFDVVVPYAYNMTDSEVADYIKNKVAVIDASYRIVIDIDKAYA